MHIHSEGAWSISDVRLDDVGDWIVGWVFLSRIFFKNRKRVPAGGERAREQRRENAKHEKQKCF